MHTSPSSHPQSSGNLQKKEKHIRSSPFARTPKKAQEGPQEAQSSSDPVRGQESPHRYGKALSEPSGYTPDLYDAIDRHGQESKKLIPIKNIRQRNDFECWASCTMMLTRFYGVGTDDMDELVKILGTNRRTSTDHWKVVEYLESLGLQVEARDEMTIEDLVDYWDKGWPVLCAITEYGDPTKGKHEEEPKDGPPPEYNYGHAVVYIGGPSLGMLFVSDPSLENILDGEQADNVDGVMPIALLTWLSIWHDIGPTGEEFNRFGIAVGPPKKGEKKEKALRTTPRSGGPITGTPPPKAPYPRRSGVGEGEDAYQFDAPRTRVKSEGGLNDPPLIHTIPNPTSPHRTPPHPTRPDLTGPHHGGQYPGKGAGTSYLTKQEGSGNGEERKYSCAMFNIADAEGGKEALVEIHKILDSIAEEDLAEDGIERESHVTLLWGIR